VALSPIAVASSGTVPPATGCPLDAPGNRIQHVIAPAHRLLAQVRALSR